jgi:hypothetical protein
MSQFGLNFRNEIAAGRRTNPLVAPDINRRLEIPFSHTAQQRALEIKPIPEHYFAGLITQLNCAPYRVRLEAFQSTLPGDPTAWSTLAFSGDGEGSWGPCGTDAWCQGDADDPSCNWDAELSFEGAQLTAAGNRIRFRPSASSTFGGGPETPVRLLITGTRRDNVGCDPH